MELKIEYMSTAELKPYENNAKEHPKDQIEQIKESIRLFEMVDPIGIWGPENVIVEGHGRLMACQELGIKQVPIVRLDHLTDEERKAYALVHNQTTLTSGFDEELLRVEIEDIKEIDMSEFGFNIDTIPDFDVREDDYDEDPPLNPYSEAGQVYKLGRHKVMCGDSTKPEDVKKLVAGVKIDILVTDPPYNVDYEGKAGKIINDSMEDEAFRNFLRKAYEAADAVMKPGAAFYIWHADSEGLNFRQACKEAGWTVRQNLIWVKNALNIGRQDYQWIHEPCLYGWKDGAAHYFTDSRKESTVIEDARPNFGSMKKDEMRKLLEDIYADKIATTAIHMNKPQTSELHPTMKPVALFDYQIKNSSRLNANVLDLFGGSGTTIIACEQNNRNAYLMEYDPKFVDVIIDRWEKFTGQKAELIEE